MNNITLKSLVDEDWCNYKLASMFLIFPNCTFKCGEMNCQNSELAKANTIIMTIEGLIERYLRNPITKALVCGGLEPLDSPNELIALIDTFRNGYECNDDIVIYTGYTEKEARPFIAHLLEVIGWSSARNIIVKYGRYIPNEKSHLDELLGIRLISDNQYAKRIID